MNIFDKIRFHWYYGTAVILNEVGRVMIELAEKQIDKIESVMKRYERNH